MFKAIYKNCKYENWVQNEWIKYVQLDVQKQIWLHNIKKKKRILSPWLREIDWRYSKTRLTF